MGKCTWMFNGWPFFVGHFKRVGGLIGCCCWLVKLVSEDVLSKTEIPEGREDGVGEGEGEEGRGGGRGERETIPNATLSPPE